MKEIELMYARSQQLLNNWSVLDGLKDDEAIKAFGIRNTIESTFKDMADYEQKLANERQQIMQKVQEIVQSRKDDPDDSSADDTEFKPVQGGNAIQVLNLPDDLSAKYRPKISEKQVEIDKLMQKKKTIEIDPLTREDLKKHDMIKNSILRQVPEIVDVLPKQKKSDKKDD